MSDTGQRPGGKRRRELEAGGAEPPRGPGRKDTGGVPPRILRLQEGLDLQRAKLSQIIAALVASGVLGSAEIGSPQAAIVPEERRLRGGSTAVITFGGMAQRLSLPAAEFLRTLTDTEADVYYYKDFHQCWYQQGLPGLSRDVPSTAQHIRAQLALHPYNRIVAIGTSAGAFAAILFGVLVGAHRIVALGPQTLVDAASFEEFAGADSRISDIDFTSEYVDLARFLDQHPYQGEIDIYYGARHPKDREAAERLRRFKCVSLMPLDTDQHNVAFRLKREHRLEEALGI